MSLYPRSKSPIIQALVEWYLRGQKHKKGDRQIKRTERQMLAINNTHRDNTETNINIDLTIFDSIQSRTVYCHLQRIISSIDSYTPSLVQSLLE